VNPQGKERCGWKTRHSTGRGWAAQAGEAVTGSRDSRTVRYRGIEVELWSYLAQLLTAGSECVCGRLDPLQPQVNLCLAPMMRGVCEIRPEPFQTCHVPFWLRFAGIPVIAALQKSKESFTNWIAVSLSTSTFTVSCTHSKPTRSSACVPVKCCDMSHQFAETHLLRSRAKGVPIGGHGAGNRNREVARNLPVLQQDIFLHGLGSGRSCDDDDKHWEK